MMKSSFLRHKEIPEITRSEASVMSHRVIRTGLKLQSICSQEKGSKKLLEPKDLKKIRMKKRGNQS